METEWLKWDDVGFFGWMFCVFWVFFKVWSLNGFWIVVLFNEKGVGVEIHLLVVVELCVLGDGVKIGFNVVVCGSILGLGVRVDLFVTVNVLVFGVGVRVGWYGFVNFCTLYF